MKAVLIPVKKLDEVKSRQSGALSLVQRISLVRAMLADVGRQLDLLLPRYRVVLATPDRAVADFGLDHGWEVILEARGKNESDSVDRASALLEARGISHVLRLPADTPMVLAEDLEVLLAMNLSNPAAIAVPSRDGTGTNALLRFPPTAFPSRFGPDSLRLHAKEAASRGVPLHRIENPRIALDLDTCEDLQYFLQVGDPNLESFQLVANWNRSGGIPEPLSPA